ncbi:hypothetical protein D3C73_1523460 [compost metagenome]
MLFCDSIPGQEDKNRDYFVRHGYGQELASPEVLDAWLDKIRDSYSVKMNYKATDTQSKTIFDQYETEYEPEACARSIMDLLQSTYSLRRLNIMIRSAGHHVN